MVRRFFFLVLAFILSNVVAGGVAALVLQPLFNSSFGDHIRTPEEGLHIASLLGGYFLLVVLIEIALQSGCLNGISRLQRGLSIGIYVGVSMFVAGHLVTAGWSKLDPFAMFCSGFFDTLAAVVAGIVLSTSLPSNSIAKP